MSFQGYGYDYGITKSVLLIDNYDSFVYNLVQYVEELGYPTVVFRNDSLTTDQIEKLAPSCIIISPGPCTPSEAGISLTAIRHFAGVIPILGVCLGHQAIGQAFGGRVIRAQRPIHGKTSLIHHDGRTIFSGLPNPFPAARYHSLVIDPVTLPDELEVSAVTAAGEIMGVRHRCLAVEGVQFHPESILTGVGKQILRNFFRLYVGITTTTAGTEKLAAMGERE